jgi:hypothetical protein
VAWSKGREAEVEVKVKVEVEVEGVEKINCLAGCLREG